MAEQEKKKRNKRRSYLKDFEKDATGQYVYKGKMLSWKEDRKPTLLRLWLFGIILAACILATGCFPNQDLNGRFYLLIPYIVSVVGAIMLIYALVRLTYAGENVREYVHKQTFNRMPAESMVTCIASYATAAAQIVCIFLSGYEGSRWIAVLSAVLMILSGTASMLFYIKVNKMKW